MSGEQMADGALARAMVGVKGMDSVEARAKVHRALAEVPGVQHVATGADHRVVVEYDPSEATVMDLIRALRRIGFLAGME